MNGIRVETAGLQSTIQDLGRPGYAHLGISACGAADVLALRAGNRLLGNPEQAAAVEMTLVGASFSFEQDAWIILAGSDFGATLGGQALPPWIAARAQRGDRLDMGPTRDGARCYLCVLGGLDVPLFLGSASTHVVTGVGGLGRPMQTGDFLPIRSAAPRSAPHAAPAAALNWVRAQYAPGPLRVTPGPQAEWFAPAALARFCSSEYTVLEQSNRMGIRLHGPAIEAQMQTSRSLLTEGVSLGAVQIPGGGQPIILFVEHQTTGGYPKIANVCGADLHRVGQLRPRDRIRFELITFDVAQALYLEREAAFERLLS